MTRDRSGRDRWTDDRQRGWFSGGGATGASWQRFTGRFGDVDAWPDGGRSANGPGGERPAEPTVLVESDGCELMRLASLALLDEQFHAGDGVVVVGGDGDGATVVAQTSGSVRGLSPAHVGVVDRGGSLRGDRTGPVLTVDTHEDPAALTRAVESCFRELNEAVSGRIHLFVDGVGSGPGESADEVYDRMYELAMGVGTEPGLALFGLDRRTVGAGLCERLPHLFDVQVALRECRGEPEAYWTALTGASDGWQAVRELSFGEPAFA